MVINMHAIRDDDGGCGGWRCTSPFAMNFAVVTKPQRIKRVLFFCTHVIDRLFRDPPVVTWNDPISPRLLPQIFITSGLTLTQLADLIRKKETNAKQEGTSKDRGRRFSIGCF